MPSGSNISIGPGLMFVAPLGTTVPTNASSALDAAFVEVGYTEDGSTFAYSISSSPVEVAEELDPIRMVTTGRTTTVTLSMAEATRRNLALALNAGAGAANNAAAIDPPAPGAEVRVIGVINCDNGARWLFRQMFQTGNVEVRRKKAPDKTLITVTFSLEKPDLVQPFRVWPNAQGLI